MRVIRMELVAKLTSDDSNISLSSDELRKVLFQEIQLMDSEITDLVRQRANSYFPENYSVFVRTHLDPAGSKATTELWIVDPTVRWPFGLLTRSAWKILAPMLAHVVRESFESRLQSISLDIDPKCIRITDLTPMRTWRDPVILSFMMVVMTSIYWLYIHEFVNAWRMLL